MPPSQLNPQVSAGLGAVIDKALEKDRNLRYQHASDMLTDLQRLKRDSDSGRHVAARSSTPATIMPMAEAPPSPSGTVAPPQMRRLLLVGATCHLLSGRLKPYEVCWLQDGDAIGNKIDKLILRPNLTSSRFCDC